MLTIIKAGDAHNIEQYGDVTVITQPYKGITRGFGEFMEHYPHTKDKWVSYQPHDVIVDYAKLLEAVKASPVAMFQPALTDDSYGSWKFTYQRGRTGWHQIPFVEAMMPVWSWEFYLAIARYMGESKSGWGLDFIWARAHWDVYDRPPMICCDVTMKHTQPVQSQHFVIDGRSSHDEMHALKIKYNV
jgi:hypothetical protein